MVEAALFYQWPSKGRNGLMGPVILLTVAAITTTHAFYSGVFGENLVTRVAAPDFSGQGFLRIDCERCFGKQVTYFPWD
jgi:hypothetical protein